VSNGLVRPKRPDYRNGPARASPFIIGPQILESGPAQMGHGPAWPNPFMFYFLNLFTLFYVLGIHHFFLLKYDWIDIIKM